MKYLLVVMLCLLNLNMNSVDAAAQKQNVETSANVGKISENDPIVIKMADKDVKLSQVLPMLLTIVGRDLSSLSQEQLLSAVEMVKKMYVMQELLIKESMKKKYQNNPKFAAEYKKAQEDTSVKILMQETGKEFTDASLKNAYAQFEKSWKRLDYKFNIILVDDESSAKSVIAGLSNGIAFDAIAKEKSVHKSSDSSKPGFVDFLREDLVAQQFGSQVLASMRNLNANDLSKAPIRTANGKFAVIKLLSKRNSPVPSFEDAKSALRMQLTNEKFSKLIEDEIKSGRVKLYTFDGKEQKFDDIFKKNKPIASAK